MTLAQIYARRERVIRLHKSRYPIRDIASITGLCTRQVKRIIANDRLAESREAAAVASVYACA